MARLIQTIAGRAANPGATLTALTMATGDSLTVKGIAAKGNILLEQVWAQEATLGVARIRSARLHDAAQGIRLRVSQSAQVLLPYETPQQLEPLDILTAELSGGGAETDVLCALLYYDQVAGNVGRYATWDQISARIVNILGNEIALTTSATAGDWGGSSALNKTFDTIKPVDYALLGFLSDTAVGAIGITGPDTGQVRFAVPGALQTLELADYFVELARQTGRPHIPIINGINKGVTNVDAIHTTASVAINVTCILAELSGPAGGPY